MPRAIIGASSSSLLAILALVCSGCCDSGSSSSKGRVPVTNSTQYFIHVLSSGGGSEEYVEPGDTVTVTEGEITALIAPGQGAKGIVQEFASCCSNSDDSVDCGSVTVTPDAGGLAAAQTQPTCSGGSCPYVYSDDKLTGESLVGALNRGGARDDVIVLPDLQPRDGSYRVRVAAELNETEFIDEAWLEVLDHPSGVRIAKDLDGVVRAVGEASVPSRVTAANGESLGQVLDSDDGIDWEGRGRDRDRMIGGKIRDWVEITFRRPESEAKATLLVHGRNSSLLQDAYHEYMAGFGPGLPKLMRAMTKLSKYGPALQGYLRDSGFSLDVSLKRHEGWASIGTVGPVGTAGEQTVAVPIDLPSDGSDTVTVRVAMLPGGWLLDSAAMAFGPTIHVSSQRVSAAGSVRSPGDKEPASRADLETIAHRDGSHLRVNTRTSIELRFIDPPREAGVDRTVALHLSGYYEENDASPKRCIKWRALLKESLQENSFAHHVLKRLAYEDLVDRYADEAEVRRPR
jgi:hypothetical protein